MSELLQPNKPKGPTSKVLSLADWYSFSFQVNAGTLEWNFKKLIVSSIALYPSVRNNIELPGIKSALQL